MDEFKNCWSSSHNYTKSSALRGNQQKLGGGCSATPRADDNASSSPTPIVSDVPAKYRYMP